MIRVLKIQVHEFRGIRDLTLNLKGENFAICGPNGTGKSGIVDAIEFALTGNISRLAGAGTGGLSVKEHGPHVDSRNKPEEAYVILTLQIPSLGIEAVLRRGVKTPKNPEVIPDTPEVRAVLEQVALHPEFVLSRRELIRYVLAEPGKRSKEVQELLRLDEVESLRTVLQRIANASTKSAESLERTKKEAASSLLTALGVAELKSEKLLAAVNEKRSILGLASLTALESTTSLKDGITTTSAPTSPTRILKGQARSDVAVANAAFKLLKSAETIEAYSLARGAAEALAEDAEGLADISREQLLRTALEQFAGASCPVCDTAWSEAAFREHIAGKLAKLKLAAEKRAKVEVLCKPVLEALSAARSAFGTLLRYGSLLAPAVALSATEAFQADLAKKIADVEGWETPEGLTLALSEPAVPSGFAAEQEELAASIEKLPDPSVQEAARDFLVIAQERLESYRKVSQDYKVARDKSEKAEKVCEIYGTSTTSALDNIYKKVETVFSELYIEINKEDEGGFTAKLTPSFGKLGFDVDFYGRGKFPPGAYHSEGHQDGMGLCLYLALVSHLQGKAFTLAVLDDVLMSVDAGHRRDVCALLKAKFPGTQFILTTHDEVWLRHMRTAGLVKGGALAHFRKWTVDQGPTEWDSRDVWQELQNSLDSNDVQGAAATLRHYLEYFAREACHRLRARVEFRGDHQFMLGDLMPHAVSAMGDLLRKAKAAANSWGNKEALQRVTDLEKAFSAAKASTNVENWQINTAVHYNEWAKFQKKDFLPVVDAFRSLVDSMRCATCDEVLYVLPERGDKQSLRCSCAEVNISLVEKTS